MKYLEDFVPGEVEMVGEHQLTQEEMIAFSKKWDPQFFHMDPEAADNSIFHRLTPCQKP